MITPNEEVSLLAKKLGIKSLFLKREDLHPLLSHKGRSMPFMIDEALKENVERFVMSSSGNAGIASLLYIKKLNSVSKKSLSLKIFVGQNINNNKFNFLKDLEDKNIKIEKVDRPTQKAFEEKKGGAFLLRQSTDKNALIGYEELAKELLLIKNLSDVFVPSSSGTLGEGIANFLVKEKKGVAVHIVQTNACCPIALELGARKEKDEPIIADAIVDKIAHRKTNLPKIIKKTGGAGWIPENDIIKKSIKILKGEGVDTTENGALSLAGLIKALQFGFVPQGAIALIIGGK